MPRSNRPQPHSRTTKGAVVAKKKKATPRSTKRVRVGPTKTLRRPRHPVSRLTTRNPFSRLATADGVATRVVVGERVEGRWELVSALEEIPVTATRGLTARLRRRARAVAELMAAVGHPQRIVILATLLSGPATYRALHRATSLEAGPLYHHINCLRLAGLILPKQRDLYETTRAGRNLVLIAAATSTLTRDRRRRPV